MNSYITVMADEAMEAAQAAEDAIASGGYLGPMHGVPVAIKDQLWTKGVLTTAGSNVLKDFVPEEDATVVSRLKEAGAVVIGKTNLTEFAITTEPLLSLRNDVQPVEQGTLCRILQRRVGVCDGSVYVRYVAGGGYGGVGAGACGGLWASGVSEHLRAGEPIRAAGGVLVEGRYWADFADDGGLCDDAPSHRGI